MDLTNALVWLFGIASRLQVRARGFALLLLIPVVLIAVTDWRIRQRR